MEDESEVDPPALTEVMFNMPGSAKGNAGGSAVTSTTQNAVTRVTPGDSTAGTVGGGVIDQPVLRSRRPGGSRSPMCAAGVLAEQG